MTALSLLHDVGHIAADVFGLYLLGVVWVRQVRGQCWMCGRSCDAHDEERYGG